MAEQSGGKLTFYFDRNFGKRLPEAIRQANPPFNVQYHHDPKGKFKFRQTTPDDEWLAKVGAEGWVVFSHDQKFHQLATEREAIKQHQIGCFYVWGANSGTWEKMGCFVKGYERVFSLVTKMSRPYIYRLGQNCRVTEVKMK